MKYGIRATKGKIPKAEIRDVEKKEAHQASQRKRCKIQREDLVNRRSKACVQRLPDWKQTEEDSAAWNQTAGMEAHLLKKACHAAERQGSGRGFEVKLSLGQVQKGLSAFVD